MLAQWVEGERTMRYRLICPADRGDRGCRPCSDNLVKNHRFEHSHSLKDRIVGDQASSLPSHCSPGLKGIRRSKPMKGSQSRRKIRDLQIRRNPIEIGISRQQTIEFIRSLLVADAIGLNQQFCHRNRRSDSFGVWSFKPGKNVVGVGNIARMILQLIDKNAGIEGDSSVASKERS